MIAHFILFVTAQEESARFTNSMIALIIELEGEVKEAFSYERPLSEGSHQALIEYARANYGPGASFRSMTAHEERNFIRHGSDSFKLESNRKGRTG